MFKTTNAYQSQNNILNFSFILSGGQIPHFNRGRLKKGLKLSSHTCKESFAQAFKQNTISGDGGLLVPPVQRRDEGKWRVMHWKSNTGVDINLLLLFSLFAKIASR